MPDVSLAVLTGSLVALAVFSFMLAPRARTPEGFFFGSSPAGVAPGVWTLTFSQVTTWIFARSLLNAGILGYFFGIAGALAYAAVAVSGTAALFLTPVIIWSIALDREVTPAALAVAVAAALLAAVVYFLESSGHIWWVEGLTGITHNYSKLLLLNVLALATGLAAFAAGDRGPVRRVG